MKVFFLFFVSLWSLPAVSGIKSLDVDFKEKKLVKNGVSVLEYFQKTELLNSNSNKYSVESGFYVKDYKGELKEEVFDSISIELPREEVFKYFESHNVIRNRGLSSNKLIIGCGNLRDSPVYERIFDQDDEIELSLDDVEEDLDSNYEEPTIKYALCHHHKGFDTIDLNVLMNPTIVGEFGGESSLAGTIFPEHHYEVIYFEGTFPVDNYERVESEFEKILKPGASVKMVENCDGCFVDSEVIYVAGKGWTDSGLYYIEDTKRKAELIGGGNFEIEIWREGNAYDMIP